MNYKNFANVSTDIRKNIFKIQDTQYDLVVGLPRSGMIPAYMIALHLNIEVTDLGSLIENIPLKKGSTRKSKKDFNLPQQAMKILLVDDSIDTGNSLKNDLNLLPDELREKVTTVAIYSSKSERTDIDIFFEYLPSPRIFEWNVFHKSTLVYSCVDIDGVLCIDPTEEENDDGEKYINFILNAKPLFLPTAKIHSLVTSRLEKYRSETEQWLSKHNIIYDHLIMLNLPSKKERQRLSAHGKHKAIYYKASKTDLFIESDARQASEISNLTGKVVLCIDNNTFYKPNLLNLGKRNPKLLIKNIPEPIKAVLRPLKKLFKREDDFLKQ